MAAPAPGSHSAGGEGVGDPPHLGAATPGLRANSPAVWPCWPRVSAPQMLSADGEALRMREAGSSRAPTTGEWGPWRCLEESDEAKDEQEWSWMDQRGQGWGLSTRLGGALALGSGELLAFESRFPGCKVGESNQSSAPWRHINDPCPQQHVGWAPEQG